MTSPPLHLGIDIGTQGVRAILATDSGIVVARGGAPLLVPDPGPIQEQHPEDWWSALRVAIDELGSLRDATIDLAVSCTSGSVCMLDGLGSPVAPSLLYADTRGIVSDGVDTSWAKAKIAWLIAERHDIDQRTALFTSPGGYITGRLAGVPTPIDVTQALKFGFDPETERWTPSSVERHRLPDVVATGTEIGTIRASVAKELGLPSNITIHAGATDGIAAQLACRPSPERWTVTIGSTTVWKTMARDRISLPERGIYSHRGPEGWWLPGAASNAGARILSSWASSERLAELDASVRLDSSTSPSYPSQIRGERFPFVDPDFRPWELPAANATDRYASTILGAAFVERWGIDALVESGCAVPRTIVATGGSTAAQRWLQLRAEVLGIPIEVPVESDSAFGAAVIAASSHAGGVLRAAEAMVTVEQRVEPSNSGHDWSASYEEFRSRCRTREKE